MVNSGAKIIPSGGFRCVHVPPPPAYTIVICQLNYKDPFFLKKKKSYEPFRAEWWSPESREHWGKVERGGQMAALSYLGVHALTVANSGLLCISQS